MKNNNTVELLDDSNSFKTLIMTNEHDIQTVAECALRINIRRDSHEKILDIVAKCMIQLTYQTSPCALLAKKTQHPVEIKTIIMDHLEGPITDDAVTRAREMYRQSCNWTDRHENFYDSPFDYLRFAIDEEMAIIRNTHGLARQSQLMRLIDVHDWTRTTAKKWRIKAFRKEMIEAYTAHLPKDMRKAASGIAGKMVDKVCHSVGM